MAPGRRQREAFRRRLELIFDSKGYAFNGPFLKDYFVLRLYDRPAHVGRETVAMLWKSFEKDLAVRVEDLS